VVQQFKERRRHIRKIGQGLVMLIDGRVYPIVDISTAGISFQAGDQVIGAVIDLKLAAMTDLGKGIEARITINSNNGTITRGEFHPTVPLLRFIIGHIGEVTGTVPAYFTR
jgi:hypothetical protein